MKGIYLTQQAKEGIEARIAELEKVYNEFIRNQLAGTLANRALVNTYKELLSSAIILPAEESWNRLDVSNYCKDKYPNGVIIQPK